MSTRMRTRARSATRTVLALTGAAVLLGGCGEITNTIHPNPGTADQITVALEGAPGPSDIGLYETLARGYFRQADLDVTFKSTAGDSTGSPIGELDANKATIAITTEPDVLFARNGGDPVVSVAAIVQKPLESIISLGSRNIRHVADLKGKKVGLVSPVASSESAGDLRLQNQVLALNGLSSATIQGTQISADEADSSLLSGKLDATIGGDWNTQVPELEQHHKQADVITFDQAGVPTYNGLVIAVHKGQIVDGAPLIRRFVQAVARGYAATRANPQRAVDDMIAAVPSLKSQRPQLLSGVVATMSDFFPTGGHPWGWQAATQWNTFGTWMKRRKLLTNSQAPVDAATNELLAGQGI